MQPRFTYDSNLTPQQNMEALIPRLNHLLAFLDSKNVKRIDTNETVIRSADGETRINGPLIQMYDKQGTPILRLQAGYDAATLDFVFQLLNSAGDITVSMDSSTGNIIVERGTFKGSITIGTGNNVFKADSNGIYLGNALFASAPFRVTMTGAATASNLTIEGGTITGVTISIGTGNNVFKVDSNGVWLGHADYASAPFKVSMAGAAEATNLTVTGGSINVDTDLYVGNNIYLGSLNLTALKNMVFNGQVEIGIYEDDLGSPPVGFYISANTLKLSDVSKIVHDATLEFYGTYGFSGATVSGLDSSDYATQTWVNAQGFLTGTTGATGSFTSADGKTISVSNGLITSIV